MGKRVIGLNNSLNNKDNWQGAGEMVSIINDYFKKNDYPEEQIEESPNYRSWSQFIHPGFSLIHRIYNKEEDCFFMQEAAISKVPTPSPEMMYYLLESQANSHLPYRFGVRDSMLLINFHCFLNGISEENLKIRLNTFEKYCNNEFEILSDRYGIKPLHRPRHIGISK